jgi:hypothetical protein
LAGESSAGCRGCGAALATVALLWLTTSAAFADETGGRELAAAFDGCMAHPRLVEIKDRPESIEWDPPLPAPKAKKKRKKRGAETALTGDLRLFCPELHAAIERSSFALVLPEDWSERMTPRKLERLRAMMLADAAREPEHRLDTAAVTDILDEMQTVQAGRELSLWQRFKKWIAGLLEKKDGKKESSWLADWLEKHSPSREVMRWIGYGLLVLLVVAAGWIVYSELRAAGMFGGRARRGGASRVAARAAAGGRPAKTLAEANDEEQPALLIAMLLEQLRRLGRVQDRLSMTHRELASAASFDSSADREVFATLIAVAEKLRYAALAPARMHLRQAIDSAKLLLARLLQPPRSAA